LGAGFSSQNKRRVSKKSDRKSSKHDEVLAEQARAVLGCYHLGPYRDMLIRSMWRVFQVFETLCHPVVKLEQIWAPGFHLDDRVSQTPGKLATSNGSTCRDMVPAATNNR
jgi:hypothetical protein